MYFERPVTRDMAKAIIANTVAPTAHTNNITVQPSGIGMRAVVKHSHGHCKGYIRSGSSHEGPFLFWYAKLS